MGVWDTCIRGLGDTTIDPAHEAPSTQNCWSWALKKFALSGWKGRLIIEMSPRARVLRLSWEPDGPSGPLWHFEPLRPKKGLFATWHAYLHEGRPIDLRSFK
jgi:hypothetical protein